MSCFQRDQHYVWHWVEGTKGGTQSKQWKVRMHKKEWAALCNQWYSGWVCFWPTPETFNAAFDKRDLKIVFLAQTGVFLCLGADTANDVSVSAGDDELFLMKLINRPMLILRGENGFVCHHKNSNTLDANRSVYDIFSLIFNDGAYIIKSKSFHVWNITF